jgi:toxin-antitoxin system PIN domain toxin
VVVVDANVLLHAVNSESSSHDVARAWLDSALDGAESVGLAWVALLAFIRISTRPGIYPRPLAPADAMDVVEGWLSRPSAVVVEPTPRHAAVLRALLEGAGTAGNLTTDAHLAALALEHKAEIASFDRDFQRFEGLRSRVPSAA